MQGKTIALGMAAALCLFQRPAHAQVLYGSLVGTVQDASGAVVPGAKVSATNAGTGQSVETTANDAGLYAFSALAAGAYHLTVTTSGFRAYTEQNIIVSANTSRRADVKLEVGQITESVKVEAAALVLQTEKTDINVELPVRALQELPLPNYRNYQSLINLVPGATPGRFQNAINDTPARSLTTNINGVNRQTNTTRIDGAASVFISMSHHTVYVPPSETIEAVNISTNNFDPEQGMAGGAAITVTTRSGTNDFHGSGFAFYDNQGLRAKNFFTRGAKAKSIRNIDGVTASGPIIRNKMFYFASWEGNRERLGFDRLATVPTPDQRRGDFSAYRTTTIFDPLSGSPDGSGRTAFAGNIVPEGRLSPILRRMQDPVPLPNQPGVTANYFTAGTQGLNRDNIDAKINWNRTGTQTYWGKYSLMDAQVSCEGALGPAGGAGLGNCGPGIGDTFVQVGGLGHTWTLTPNFVWDGNFGYTRMGQEDLPLDFGVHFGRDILGIPGTNGPDIRQSGKPAFAISGYETLGNPNNWDPIYRNDQSYTTDQNFSWVKGTHNLRFGFQGTRHHLIAWQPSRGGGPRGRFDFENGLTGALRGPSVTQFNAYAGFLLGLPRRASKSLQAESMTTFEWQWAGYIRDRWQVARDLTLTLGLRYEYYPLLTRAGRGGMEMWDPGTNRVFLGGNGGVPKGVGVDVSKRLLAPRVGLAYRLNPLTVVRSGYGIAYNPALLTRSFRGSFPMLLIAEFESPNTFQPLSGIDQGIPPIPFPNIHAGVLSLPPTFDFRFISGSGSFGDPPTFDRGTKLNRGYVQSWNFVIEREMPWQILTSIAYVGTQTVRQFADWDGNAAGPGQGTAGRPFFAPYGRTAPTRFWNGSWSANYHAMQLTFNRRAAGGLFFKGAYTWSKAINFTDDDGEAGLNFNYLPHVRRNRALAGYDQPHNFQLAWIYDLPFGAGKRYAQAGWQKWLLGDWQVNGVASLFTGRPYTVVASGTALNAPGNTQTGDQVKPDVSKLGNIGPGQLFFDPTAFAPVNQARFGNVGRNTMRAPGVVNMDLGVFRTFPLGEQFRLQFKAEAFNAANTPHFSGPGSNVNSANFAQVTGAEQDQRQFRLGMRLHW